MVWGGAPNNSSRRSKLRINVEVWYIRQGLFAAAVCHCASGQLSHCKRIITAAIWEGWESHRHMEVGNHKIIFRFVFFTTLSTEKDFLFTENTNRLCQEWKVRRSNLWSNNSMPEFPIILSHTWNSCSSFFSIHSVTWPKVTSLSPSLGRAFSSRWGGLRKPYLTRTKKGKIVCKDWGEDTIYDLPL